MRGGSSFDPPRFFHNELQFLGLVSMSPGLCEKGEEMNLYYQSENEIEAVINGFESCLTAKDQFPHRNHLTVAVWYLRESTIEQAAENMRAGLLKFLDHHGVSRMKYNETITIFWLRLVNTAMKEIGRNVPLLEITNRVIEVLNDSRLALQYYTPDLLNSDEAKNRWVEPNLKPL